MDFRVLMIQSIALLFWESITNEGKPESGALVNELIAELPSPDNVAGTDEDKENLVSLRSIASSLANSNNPVDQQQLLHRVKIGIKKDPELRKDVEEILNGDIYDQDTILQRCVHLRVELKEFFRLKRFKDDVKKFVQKTLYNPNEYNITKVASEFRDIMEVYATNVGEEELDPALNNYLDLDDLDKVKESFEAVQEDINPESTLKTGWQGLNRMFGEIGGLRRGNMYVFGAMPSKGKSLVSMCLAMHVPMFNNPYMEDPKKKPLIVHFSTENDTALNLKIMYRALWEDEHQSECDLLNTPPEQMAKYFKDKITARGYGMKFFHIDPTKTGYHGIIDRLKEIESQGYEIHMTVIDYLAMLNNDGLGDENRAFWIRQLFKVVRNYCNPRKITAITPHQVSTDASMYLRQGTDDFVRSIAGKRYWADCRSIDMEVDCEIVMNIEQDGQGNSWMAFGRGKDRSSANTPERDKFFFIPFSKFGGLRPDIDKTDTSKRSIRSGNDINIADSWKGGDNGVASEF